MRNWIWVSLAAIVGLVAGSWGPREDLEVLKSQMREVKTKRTATEAGFGAFARLANIPDVASGKRKREMKPDGVATNEVVEAGKDARPLRRMSVTNDLASRLEEAAELWNTRVELAKTQWKEKLGISDGAAADSFEAAIGSMNEALHETMEAMAEEIERAGQLNTELGLRLMGDVTRIMAETYDAIGPSLNEEQRKAASEMPVFEFIDPMVAEPLVRVQDKIGEGLIVGRGRRSR